MVELSGIDTAIQVIPYALVGVFVVVSGVWHIPADMLYMRYAKRFICPKKGHVVRHIQKTVYVICNLGHEHFDHYEETPRTFCNRCEMSLST